MTHIILILCKVLDNIVSTTKSIFVARGKKIVSSILVAVSQFLFYTIITEVVADNSLLVIFMVSVASGIGNYLAFPIANKFTPDDKWYYYLTTHDKEDVAKLCRYLAKHNIKYMANLGLTRHGEETINVTAFSKTKDESRLIDNYLHRSNSKYLKEIMK